MKDNFFTGNEFKTLLRWLGVVLLSPAAYLATYALLYVVYPHDIKLVAQSIGAGNGFQGHYLDAIMYFVSGSAFSTAAFIATAVYLAPSNKYTVFRIFSVLMLLILVLDVLFAGYIMYMYGFNLESLVKTVCFIFGISAGIESAYLGQKVELLKNG